MKEVSSMSIATYDFTALVDAEAEGSVSPWKVDFGEGPLSKKESVGKVLHWLLTHTVQTDDVTLPVDVP